MKKLNSFLLISSMVLLLTSSESFAQCSVNAGSDATVYVGYPALACATLTAVPAGAAPYSYVWSNGATTASITVCNTVATIYTVTVTDANGCISTDNVTVNVIDVRCGNNGKKVMMCHTPKGNPGNAHTICISPRAVAAHLAHGDVLGDCTPPPPPCLVSLGNDASFCSGGSYLLDAGTGFTSYLWSNGSTSQTLTVTQGGTYWVQATDIVRNCTVSDTVNILVNAAPLITIVADSLPDSLGCRNITGTASGGTPPYLFAWSPGGPFSVITVCDTVATTYTLTVVDANGCTSTDSITVVPVTPCAVNLGPDASSCSGDSLLLDAGTGFTSYMWSDSSTAQTLNVTQSGTYWVQATDTVLGCTASDTIAVLFDSPVVSVIADSIPDSLGCRNITGSASGGTPPYLFTWSTGDSTAVINVCDTVTMTYVLTVVDSNGCSSTDSVTVVQATPCLVNLGPDASFCSGDSVVLDAGIGFQSYLWSDSSTAQTLTVTLTGLYWVQATDTVLGCTASDSIIVFAFNSPVVSAVADSLPDSLGCRNITASVTGGTPPFEYSWSTGDSTSVINVCDTVSMTYFVTVVDSNGCTSSDSVFVVPANVCEVNLGPDVSFCAGDSVVLDAKIGQQFLWSDSSDAQTLTVTQSGIYWVQATDTLTGCIASDTIEVIVLDSPVISFVVDSVPDSLGCRNITASVTGGTPPFVYTWSTGDSTAVINVCDTVTMAYVLTVIDSNTCSSSDSVTVTPTCEVNLGPNATLCSGDTLLLDAGAGFTNYLWSNNSTGQTLAIIVGGTYWVQATDTVSGCTASDTIQVLLLSSPVVTVIADSIPDSLGCRNITASVTGATPPFVYTWSTGDSTAVINVCDTVTMTYVVTVAAVNGCSSTDSVTVIPPCEVNLGADTSFCSGDTLTLDAGTDFHSFLWSDSSTAQTLSVTQSGTYWIQATDTTTGCMASDTIDVVVYDSPIATAVADSIPDSLGCVNITGSFTGGTAPFTYSWSSSDTSFSDTSLVINVCDSLTITYMFTVIDSNGCSSTAAVILNDTGSRPIPIAGRGIISIRPNPFMDYAKIYFVLPESGKVKVELFDLKGTRVAVLFQGNVEQDLPYTLDFTRGDLIEALYLVRLTKADGSTLNSKMVLFKY